jgi:large subunit ribosomal protein L15
LFSLSGLIWPIADKIQQIDNLSSSGVDVVLAHTLYSIVGAVAMEKGGDFANKIVRERILSPLGLK